MTIVKLKSEFCAYNDFLKFTLGNLFLSFVNQSLYIQVDSPWLQVIVTVVGDDAIKH